MIYTLAILLTFNLAVIANPILPSNISESEYYQYVYQYDGTAEDMASETTGIIDAYGIEEGEGYEYLIDDSGYDESKTDVISSIEPEEPLPKNVNVSKPDYTTTESNGQNSTTVWDFITSLLWNSVKNETQTTDSQDEDLEDSLQEFIDMHRDELNDTDMLSLIDGVLCRFSQETDVIANSTNENVSEATNKESESTPGSDTTSKSLLINSGSLPPTNENGPTDTNGQILNETTTSGSSTDFDEVASSTTDVNVLEQMNTESEWTPESDTTSISQINNSGSLPPTNEDGLTDTNGQKLNETTTSGSGTVFDEVASSTTDGNVPEQMNTDSEWTPESDTTSISQLNNSGSLPPTNEDGLTDTNGQKLNETTTSGSGTVFDEVASSTTDGNVPEQMNTDSESTPGSDTTSISKVNNSGSLLPIQESTVITMDTTSQNVSEKERDHKEVDLASTAPIDQATKATEGKESTPSSGDPGLNFIDKIVSEEPKPIEEVII
ncbi:hypothetical protein RF11_09810 [Thelohanellus kitauei]|uniref:Uncharacterized protein n=1 Tax=Thelohanellus kitauei TaxID=669202 RepID=A0A0C2NGV4_THEKT|nr:hypothetical protein RF11_09810 [Thelohanellus kitauei]